MQIQPVGDMGRETELVVAIEYMGSGRFLRRVHARLVCLVHPMICDAEVMELEAH